MEPIKIDLSFDPVPEEGPRPLVDLTGPQKAALIVRLLAREGAGIALHRLPDSVQADLIREVGALGDLPDELSSSVIDEFAALMETAGLYGPGGIYKALELLDGSVSPAVANRIRADAGSDDDHDPWERIIEKDAEKLADIMRAECIEVGAVILSKLSVPKAAEVLGLLPGPLARRITYGVSLTSAVTPVAVAAIGRALAPALDIRPVRAFSQGPVERVGAILNFSRSATRNEVLEGLDEDDGAFADEVRQAIFTFGNIPQRVEARDVPKILREVERDALIAALACGTGEYEEARQFLLSAVSRRMAEALQDEAAELGPIDDIAGEEAMGKIVAVIRRMEEAGEIHLVAQGA